ncbi:MAG TPA: glucoamylase family protein [Chitinophagaceae bacterium]
MRKLLFSLILFSAIAAVAQERPYDYVFFVNSRMKGNYFFSKAESSGDSKLQNVDGKLPVSDAYFSTPGTSLQLEYVNGANGNWKATVYKQEIRGQDQFKQAHYLSFRIMKLSTASGNGEFPSVQLMYRDSSLSAAQTLKLKAYPGWEQVILPLKQFGFSDSTHPQKVIAIVFAQNGNEGKLHKLYVDDIEFLQTTTFRAVTAVPVIKQAKGYDRHVDIEWEPVTDTAVKYVQIYRITHEGIFRPVGMQSPLINRYSDYTGKSNTSYQYKIAFINHHYIQQAVSAPVSAATKSMSDDELMSMVQEACFRYYWDGAEKQSGLAKENIHGRHDMIATGASGFGIMAIIAATERNFITRKQAIDRFTTIVNFLHKAEKFHGVVPHFINGPTGKVEPFFGKRDNGGDLVEHSFLMQGLLAARAYFNGAQQEEKYIRDRITELWEKTEWDWYRRYPDSKFLFWHWSPDQEWVINHRLIGWNETMVTYLLAIASPTHAVPASMYYSGWANQDSTGQQYRSAWGQTKEGSMYTNGNTYFGIKLDVGVSNGGPLFFTHYSYMGYDPHYINDRYTNYFKNNRNIALINYRYCLQNPQKFKGYGDSCWGLTASDGPYDYSADEPVQRQDRGKIAPTGAISSFPYTPEQSMKALKNYYHNYGSFLWGEYGFRDAFNLTQNWCSDIYMGLNQAPMVVMIENHRTGLIWKLFMSDPDIRKGLKKLEEETSKQPIKK